MDISGVVSRPSLVVKEFDYDLPSERIAVYPMEKRDSSKLLVYKKGCITDAIYRQVDEFLTAGSLMVFNNTRVIQARLHFKTATGATVEIFCLEPQDKHVEVNQAMQTTGKIRWQCLVGELKKWKEPVIQLRIPGEDAEILLSAVRLEKDGDTFVIEFSWTPDYFSFAEILEKAGRIPLPPYIKRELNEDDKQRYQTIYALHEGSVAAPTAGLHYTPAIFEKLNRKPIDIDYLTLHIGAGTFKPVKSETIEGHEMHSEQLLVEKNFIEKLIGHLEQGIIAVGTTSLRTLESLYWLGLRIHDGLFDENEEIAVKQWDPYLLDDHLEPLEALRAVLSFLEKKGQHTMLTRTQVLIVPGYKWKVVNILATNFHQPKSTLVMLVAAFIGEDWKKVYRHALENNYRFLSYGDGSLLFRS